MTRDWPTSTPACWPRTPDALENAIEVCDQALADRARDSDDVWHQARLTARSAGL